MAAHEQMGRLERAVVVLSELSSQARRLAAMECEAPHIEERGAKRIVVFDNEGCTGSTSVSPRMAKAFRGFLGGPADERRHGSGHALRRDGPRSR